MGCCHSRLEKEEMISRCKARKRYIKQFVKSRHHFSASHIMYLKSLRNTGSTLIQLATIETTFHHHLPPTPPPPPPPPITPTSTSTWDSWDPFTTVEVSTKSKDLEEIIKELDEYFLRAADSGGEVSALLEVPFPGQGKVDEYGKNLRPIPKLNVFAKFGCDDIGGVGGGPIAGSHCSTVERLYAWEKKLYQEVKNVESLKIERSKRVEQLRKMELTRADYMKTEKAKKEIEKLESRMMISSQAVESTSEEIVKLQEEELYPQLVELVKGLMGMWRNLYESHQVQMHIVQQLKCLHVIPSTDLTSESHCQAVLQLEAEVQQWHLSLCNLVKSQRDYVQSLTGWLRLSLFQSPLSQTKQDFAIYTLCEEWQRVVDNAPDNVASEGIKALLTAVHDIVVQQAEDQKQKKRAESSFKELEKKMVELRAVERKFGLSEKDPVGDKRAKVEALRVKAEEERGIYEKSVGVTRAMTLSNLQMALPHVFQSLTGFANVLNHGFESVYNLAKRPNEAHDV